MFRSQAFCSPLTDESAEHAGRRTCVDNGMRRTTNLKSAGLLNRLKGEEQLLPAKRENSWSLKTGQMGTFER